MKREQYPDIYVVKRRKELEAMASPVRLQIIDIMERKSAWSARQIAEVMGRRPETLYYQLQLLEKSGLVVKSGTRPTKRSDEALYRLRAGQIRVDQERNSAGFLDLLLRTVGSMLRAFDRQVAAALQNKNTRRSGRHRNYVLSHHTLRLSKTELGELTDLLDGIQSFLDQHHANESGDRFSVLVGLAGIHGADTARARSGRPRRI